MMYACIHAVIILIPGFEFKGIFGHPSGQGVVSGVSHARSATSPRLVPPPDNRWTGLGL